MELLQDLELLQDQELQVDLLGAQRALEVGAGLMGFLVLRLRS